MPVEDQQQLRPLGLVAGLEAPRTEDVAAIALVVVPVDRPVRLVVFPDEPVRQATPAGSPCCRRAARRDRDSACPSSPRRLRASPRTRACSRSGRDSRTLASRPWLRRRRARVRRPRSVLHQVPRFVEVCARFFEAGFERFRIREHDEREPVAVVRAVRRRRRPSSRPRIAARSRHCGAPRARNSMPWRTPPRYSSRPKCLYAIA